MSSIFTGRRDGVAALAAIRILGCVSAVGGAERHGPSRPFAGSGFQVQTSSDAVSIWRTVRKPVFSLTSEGTMPGLSSVTKERSRRLPGGSRTRRFVLSHRERVFNRNSDYFVDDGPDCSQVSRLAMMPDSNAVFSEIPVPVRS
jgi:hypothetical protein